MIPFDDWMRQLDEAVVQGEYGYEEGEFDIFPEHWRHFYKRGLTPSAAFRRVLDAFVKARKREDRQRRSHDATAIRAAANRSGT